MAGYCTVDDVTSAFPQFKRNAPGSIQDPTIQGWIEDHASRIDAALAARGVEGTLTGVGQVAFLKGLNRSCAIADLGVALQETATLQPGESSLADHHCKRCDDALEAILAGHYDKLLLPETAVTANVGRGVDGIAGAETDPDSTPRSRGENRAFGKNQVF
jgi:hypothetical protein